MKPVFFATPVEFRAWLAEHHDKSQELWAAFYKRSSGRPSITWPEAVDAALCFGWIDGVRKSIDSVSYTTRFTPRRSDSTWSAVNVKRIRELRKKGLLTSAGLEAFQQRKKSGTYSYEQRHTIKLDSFYEKKLRANRKAWASFQSQAPGIGERPRFG